MAQNSFPFNSVGGDRKYNAADWADYFTSLISTGVWAEQLDALEVSADGLSLQTSVATGRAMIEGRFYYNDTVHQLTHDAADPTNNRIDAVVLRLDTANRQITTAILKGTAGVDPAAPTPTQNIAGSDTYELVLAHVLITAASSTISVDDVTDKRNDETICGYAQYRTKPAWYPGGEVPLDAWMYANFKLQLSQQEITDIEANNSLMDIVETAQAYKNGNQITILEYDLYSLMCELYYASQLTGADAELFLTMIYDVIYNLDMVDAENTTLAVDTGSHVIHNEIDSGNIAVEILDPADFVSTDYSAQDLLDMADDSDATYASMPCSDTCSRAVVLDFGEPVCFYGADVRVGSAGIYSMNFKLLDICWSDDGTNWSADIGDSSQASVPTSGGIGDRTITCPIVTLNPKHRYWKFTAYANGHDNTCKIYKWSFKFAPIIGGAVENIDSDLSDILGVDINSVKLFLSVDKASIDASATVTPYISYDGGTTWAAMTLVDTRTDKKFSTYYEKEYQYEASAPITQAKLKLEVTADTVNITTIKRYALMFFN